MKNLLFIIVCPLLVNSCIVYDPPKEKIIIINTSKYDTLYVTRLHCNNPYLEIPHKTYYDRGFQKVINDPNFIEPLDTLYLPIGYKILGSFLECEKQVIQIGVAISKYEMYGKMTLPDTTFIITKKTNPNDIYYFLGK